MSMQPDELLGKKASGWSHAKRVAFEEAFYAFLGACKINSKNLGFVSLGDNLYYGQRRFITAILDGLENDIHDFYCLKSRQLGITTICRAFSTFYLGIHKGLSGALVFDSNENKNLARDELVTMINDLPARLKFPAIKKDNRDGLSLINDSKILFKSAGVKKTKTSGTLGRSAGLAMAHLSELCSFDNEEGLVSFRRSLSDSNPDRLYIYESTARGYNSWEVLWRHAREDDSHCVCVFIGWWAHDGQKVEQGTKDWELYGIQPATAEEQHKIDQVKELYDFEISQEQLAWYRRLVDPAARDDGDTDAGFEGNSLQKQEDPWTEDEAFQQTGSVFFAGEKLKDQTDKYVSRKFTPYMFLPGTEFSDMKVYKAENTRNIELKVWEPPQPESVYVLSADPAFGENEHNDRSSLQVLRCYADGVDQVAEYAYSMISTKHLAWVMAGIMAWYGNEPLSEIYYILELNGPGGAVLQELKSLKFQIENGYAPLEEAGLKNIFSNVKQFIYARPDSLAGGGSAWHWKCLSVYEKLPTPFGWISMGDVRPDDILLDEQGNECSVLFTSEIKEARECFRITFDDKTSIVADAEHLWEVSTRKPKTSLYTKSLVTTVDLDIAKHLIPVAKPLDLPAVDLPIDPYVLGVWLGDGSSSAARIHSGIKDAEEIFGFIIEAGYDLGLLTHQKQNRNVCYRDIRGFSKTLKSEGVFGDKHIPVKYLRASKAQRMALLQGLMDTDGNVIKASSRHSRQCYFTTTSPKIAAGFAELVRSLGFKSKHNMRYRTLRYKDRDVVCAPAWQFYFTSYENVPVFRLKRKLARCSGGKTRPGISKYHKIVSVDPVPGVPVKCIQVDSPSALFLAGEGMIPTHNTTVQTKVMVLEELRGFVSNGQFHIRSHDLIEEMKTIARDGDSISAEGNMKDDRVIAAALAVHYWDSRVRRNMIVQRRTREAEKVKKQRSIIDQATLFNQNMMQSFMNQQGNTRMAQQRLAMKQAWRYGRR